MYYGYDLDENLIKLAKEAEEELGLVFQEFEENSLNCSAKVLKAFQEEMVATSDFAEVTGYGYTDEGRSKLERIYAKVFKAEDALVRAQIMSGTHALNLAFTGLLKHGDTFISISGKPYDSLLTIIGLSGDSRNSLIKNGINYEQIDLIESNFDIPTIQNRLKQGNVKLVEIQRSRGYSERNSLTIAQIEEVCKAIREVNQDVIIMIDNCYGDFVEDREPIEVGADLIVGSLMKNLGGGVAKTGGYIVGRKDLIEDIAERYSAPGLGKDIGANLNQNLSLYKGLYNAPSAVCSSLKTMAFASLLLEKLGFSVDPSAFQKRTDIIQTITLGSEENLVNFCKGIQFGAPVESYLTPVPAPMPGYPDDEVMAGGSFISGSTIELSCDGPVVPPYIAYMQGGLTYEYGKLGILIGINQILKNKK
ncbi:MAG: methionine gamma-lyase family protein [Clostridia bacterium]|nr:methionine gamma-lyase family protein [Clostridia bacterium]